MVNAIREELFRLQDKSYRDFQSRLIPSIKPETVIGVRTPELRRLAKKLIKQSNVNLFLNNLPHKYFDENQLHAFIICEIKDYEDCIKEVNHFLPYVDNWASCDQMSPIAFKKEKSKLLGQIKLWIHSKHTYTVRFAICMLMKHFLDEDFDLKYPEMVAELKSEEYYVNMMIAWYFATALAKQYDKILPFIKEKRLDTWTHNKTIQKARESNRITKEQKEYLWEFKS